MTVNDSPRIATATMTSSKVKARRTTLSALPLAVGHLRELVDAWLIDGATRTVAAVGVFPAQEGKGFGRSRVSGFKMLGPLALGACRRRAEDPSIWRRPRCAPFL